MNEDCKYSNRCKNTSICYRCFQMSLLKLPEDKEKKGNFKRKVFNHTEANKENSWEDLEEGMKDALKAIPNIEEIRRARASGALWFEKGDVLDTILKLECKERIGSELKGGDKSISIKKSWLTKATEEALEDDKVMALPFRFKGDDKTYIAMESNAIIELVNMIKALQMEFDLNEKEIKLLKEKIIKMQNR